MTSKDKPTSNMLDQILSTLTERAAPELTGKLGLDQKQANGAIAAVGESVQQIVGGGDGFGLDDALNLFSGAKNSVAADGILANIGSMLQGKLTDQVGLSASQANGVSAMLLPMITELISSHVRGDARNLQSLVGGGGLADMAKGLFSKLFK